MSGLDDIFDGQNSWAHDTGMGSMVDELSGLDGNLNLMVLYAARAQALSDANKYRGTQKGKMAQRLADKYSAQIAKLERGTKGNSGPACGPDCQTAWNVPGVFGLGKTDPNEIANAISRAFKDITGAARGDSGGSGDVPLGKVLLILGGGYLVFKVLDRGLRD